MATFVSLFIHRVSMRLYCGEGCCIGANALQRYRVNNFLENSQINQCELEIFWNRSGSRYIFAQRGHTVLDRVGKVHWSPGY